MRAMPRAAVGVQLGIGRVGERAVHRPSLLGPCACVDGRPQQRMMKRDAAVDGDQLGVLGPRSRIGGQTERPAGPPEKRRVPRRLGCGEQEQSLRVLRKVPDPAPEAGLDQAFQRSGVRYGKAARKARAIERARKLEQGERVPPRLGDDPVAHRLVQDAEAGRLEHRTSVLVGQTLKAQLG